MNFKYENQESNTYLVYEVGENEQLDSMSLGMLTNNRITGLAPMLFTQMNMSKYLKYNVTSKVSLQSFFSGVVNRKRMIGVLNGIVDALLSASDYMIGEDSILLNVEYIFTDVSTCETSLICLPIKHNEEYVDVGSFIKNIMFTTKFDQTENCDYVAHIFNFLNSNPVFNLFEFKKLLETFDTNTQTQQPVHNEPVKTQPVQQPIQQQIHQPVQQPVQQPVIQQPMQQSVQPSVSADITSGADIVRKSKSEQAVYEEPVGEERMTFMKLMMHYSKENKEKYKAQKAMKKQGKAPKEKKAKKVAESVDMGFAIPGQESKQMPIHQQQKPQPSQPSRQQGYTQQPVTQQSVQPQIQQQQYNNTPQYSNGNFGQTTVLGARKPGETTVLRKKSTPQAIIAPHLIRLSTNEKISINKPLFHIGTERAYADYCVTNNSAVSHSHADIITDNNEYYIVDTNSTNHTYINDRMIQSNVRNPLKEGDLIRLGNEEFRFYLNNR